MCELVRNVWEFFGILASFSKLVMTSVLTVQRGKMQQLILFGLYNIFCLYFKVL